MWLIIILGVILLGFGAGIGIVYTVNPIPTLFVSLGIIVFTIGVFQLATLDKPTAINVYQGKTTLEITYRNGVPVDSVVVFKNKEK